MHIPAPAAPSSNDIEVPAASLRVAWFALAIICTYQVLSFMDRMILSLLVDPIQQSLGLTDVQLGLLQGLTFSVVYGAVGLPVGWLVDRFSRRWIIFVGVLVWSVATAGCALARSFTGLFLGRAGVGAGEAALSPAAFSLISDIFPRNRLATALGIYFMGSNVGAALALTLGGLVISMLNKSGGLTVPIVGHLEPWQATFLIVGGPGIVLAGLIFLVKERPRTPPAAGSGADLGDFGRFFWSRRRVLVCHFLGFPILALAVYAAQAWSAPFMARHFRWDPAAIGLALAVAVGLFGGASNIIAGRIADGWVRRGQTDAYYRIHVFAALISAPILVAAFMSPSAWVFIGLFCIGKAFLTCFGGTALASLQLITPPHFRGKMSATYLLALAVIGGGMGPVVTAFVTEHVLGDRSQVGTAVAIVLAVSAPLGSLLLALGMKPLRQAIADAEAGLQPA